MKATDSLSLLTLPHSLFCPLSVWLVLGPHFGFIVIVMIIIVVTVISVIVVAVCLVVLQFNNGAK